MAYELRADETVDIAVIGGGPTGVAAALTLARLGAGVVVVESSTYDEPRVGETLPPGTRRLFADLDLWGALAATPSVPSVGVRSHWGAPEGHDRSFLSHPYGDGLHVDRQRFDAAVARSAEEIGVAVRRGWRLLGCEPEPGGSQVITIASAERISRVRAAFVVDATGRQSAVVHRMGGRRRPDDRLVGAFGFFASPASGPAGVAPDPDGFTLIEAVEGGWWYSAPLPGGRLVVALMTDADLCRREGLRDAPAWQASLLGAPETLARTRALSLEDGVRVVAANSSRADPVAGPGWLAAGDAAFAQDPLSGDGVPRSLEAGIHAAQVIASTVRGDDDALATYAVEIDERYESYLRRRDAYYGRETRWPDVPFWARRAAARPPTPPVPNRATEAVNWA